MSHSAKLQMDIASLESAAGSSPITPFMVLYSKETVSGRKRGLLHLIGYEGPHIPLGSSHLSFFKRLVPAARSQCRLEIEGSAQ